MVGEAKGISSAKHPRFVSRFTNTFWPKLIFGRKHFLNPNIFFKRTDPSEVVFCLNDPTLEGFLPQAGVMEHIGMYPLDTVKTHMQASGEQEPGEKRGKKKPQKLWVLLF